MIADFYKDAEIFVTGGSGIVGKSTVEKLLRSCDVKKIYILLRSRKASTPEDRLDEIKASKIFRVLKECKPKELEKLVAIPGDITEDGLGISTQYRAMMKNVSIVFHSAATTRFDEPIRRAIRLNLKATLEVMKLSETEFKNLKIFCYISTYFSNPYVDHIEDKVYPALFDWKTALKMLDYDEADETLDLISNKVIDEFPNTYSFTKHLAEKMVDDYRFKLPVAIYRPSIVTSALKEPEPGFTESKSGYLGMILVWSLGIVQTLYTSPDVEIDCSPLDITVKVLLMFCARTAQLPKETIQEKTPVTMLSTRPYVNCNMSKKMKLLNGAFPKFPFTKSIWIPNVMLTNSPFLYWWLTMILQVLPSLVIDGILRLFGKQPYLMKTQRIFLNTNQRVSYFLQHDYTSGGITNFRELLEIGKGTDFDIDEVATYWSNDEALYNDNALMVYGIRKFIMDDDDSTLSRCRTILRWKKIAYNLLRCYGLYVAGKAVLRMCMEYVE